MSIEANGDTHLRITHEKTVPVDVPLDWNKELTEVYRVIQPALEELDKWREQSRRMDFTLD